MAHTRADALGIGGKDVDADLMRRVAGGDREALAALYDRHAGRVLGLAHRILRNSGDAQDTVQDVFAQAWRTAPNYEAGRGTVAGWLLMMTRSRAIDRLRSRRARRDAAGDAMLEAIPAEGDSSSDRMIADEEAARVRDALRDLPGEQRAALELAYFEGLTQTEIAQRVDAPLGTVKTRIRTALATLRRSLRP